MDGGGNMGLAYSAGNGTTFPSIWYTGRNAGSALGTMPLGENSIINGTGSQTAGGNRWGDYSSVTVDPVDDATFWVVNQYLPTTSASGWRLRVGAFKLVPVALPSLGSATLTAGSCTPPNMVPDPGETLTVSLCVTNTGDLATTNVVGTLQATGGVSMPSGPQNSGVDPAGRDGLPDVHVRRLGSLRWNGHTESADSGRCHQLRNPELPEPAPGRKHQHSRPELRQRGAPSAPGWVDDHILRRQRGSVHGEYIVRYVAQ